MTAPRTSEPLEIKILESKAKVIAQFIAGIFFMVGGGLTVWLGVRMDNHKLMVAGTVAAVGGALVLPSIFETVKPIFIFIFPNGLPFIGGRSQPK